MGRSARLPATALINIAGGCGSALCDFNKGDAVKMLWRRCGEVREERALHVVQYWF